MAKRFLVYFATASATLWCLAATAQPAKGEVEAQVARMLEGTTYSTPIRDTVDGRLSGCGFEFGALKRDFSTKGGAPVKVIGSFYLRPIGVEGLAYSLKLGLFDGLTTTTGAAPANAFVRAPNGNAPRKARRADSDTPGYAIFVGGLDPEVVEVYKAIIEDSKLVVGFNREPGQQDVSVLLDLTVVDTRFKDGAVERETSPKLVQDFIACTRDLMKMVRMIK